MRFFKPKVEDFGVQESDVKAAQRAVDPVSAFEGIEALEAELATLQAALKAEREADEAKLEKPPGPYRIIKRDYPPFDTYQRDGREVPAMSGYYVESWSVESGGYDEYYSVQMYSPRSVAEATRKRLDVMKARKYRQMCVKWSDVGPGLPHATYADAETWLRQWLKPDEGAVYLDGEGKPIGTA